MKIAILTSFRRMPDSYSLVNDVRDQVKTLKKYGHEVVVFTQETCQGEGIECEVRDMFPHFKIEKGVVNQEVKEKIKEILERELTDFDVVITHDLVYLQQYVTYRAAIRECNLPNVKWIHWSHSTMGKMESIKMPRSKYVFMNYTNAKEFSENIGVDYDDVRVVFNDKDPRLFFEWGEVANTIADRYDLFNKDIIQTYPMCTTRMDAKGIDNVIRVFGFLKKLENNVLLIIPNSNARGKGHIIQKKIDYAKERGLTENDIVFTSLLDEKFEGGVPRKDVKDLMNVSNLFVFPSITEMCSNVLLEAAMTKQLIVLNKDFPALFDFGEENKTCLGFNFGSILKPGFKFRGEEAGISFAKIINQQLLNNKANQQFLKIIRECNIDTIYKKQIEPILYEPY